MAITQHGEHRLLPSKTPVNRSLDVNIKLGGADEADLRELIASLPERFSPPKKKFLLLIKCMYPCVAVFDLLRTDLLKIALLQL